MNLGQKMIPTIKILIAITICLYWISSYAQLNSNMKYSELNPEIYYVYLDYDRIGPLKDTFNTKTITKVDVLGQDTIGTTMEYYNQKGEINQSIVRHQTGSLVTKFYKFDSIGQLSELVKLSQNDTVYYLNIQYESNLVKSMDIYGLKEIEENRKFEYYPDSSLKMVWITPRIGKPYSCRFDYNQGDNGLMVSVRRQSSEDSLWDLTRWQFDSRYRLTSETIYTNDEVYPIQELHYKDMGRKSTTTYAYRGYKIEKRKETQDKDGYLIRKRVIPYRISEKTKYNALISEGINLEPSEFGRWTFFYDSKGRRTETYFFNRRFWPFTNVIMTTSYDNLGRVIKETSIHNNGVERSLTTRYEIW